MANCEATKKPLDQMIDRLKEEFDKAEMPPPELIKKIMADYIEAGHSDWREYALFCPIKYSRNLLEINENFELIVLCWLEGQESPIHNHSGQNCWMAVLEGEMQEVYYSIENGVLQEGSKQLYHISEVAHITDEKALHKVCPVQGSGCTIHLYSKPIPLCHIYCPKTGQVTKRKLGFYSKRGTTLPEGDPSSACYKELKKQLCSIDSTCPLAYKNLLAQIDN
jgi:cysteine dioxygenase